MSWDGRTTLARPDLAAVGLQGLAPAKNYRPTRQFRCRVEASAIRESPSPEALRQNELLFGERFDVLEVADGWAWGQAKRDGYVGFVHTEDLDDLVTTPTHRVAAIHALAFAKPDKRAPVTAALPLNGLAAVTDETDGWAEVEGAGWVFALHLAPIGDFASDSAAVAERFLGAPYLWGGRRITGIDCSGLVQQALFACGRGCPRDSDQQAAALGREIGLDELRRGDLAFWCGHVAMMLDQGRAIHASSHAMAVVTEPLTAIIERREAAENGPPTMFRRP